LKSGELIGKISEIWMGGKDQKFWDYIVLQIFSNELFPTMQHRKRRGDEELWY